MNACDLETLEALYRRYLGVVRGFLRAGGVAADDLDDVVHDTFLAVRNRWVRRDRTVPERVWVVGVARSTAHSYHRTRARRRRTLAEALMTAPTRAPDDEVARRDAWRSVGELVDRLGDGPRSAFICVDLLGMTAPEVAALDRVSVNTVYSRLRLARDSLQRQSTVETLRTLRNAVAEPTGCGSDRSSRAWAAIAASAHRLVTPVGLAVANVCSLAIATAVGLSVHAQRGEPRAPARANHGFAGTRDATVLRGLVFAGTDAPVGVDSESGIGPSEPLGFPPGSQVSSATMRRCIDLLRRGERAIDAGQPAEALRSVRRYHAVAPDDPLQPQARGLERRAIALLRR